MFLSRIPLDISNRQTMRALNSPSMFHGAVESSFPGERTRNLWRIDKLNGQMYFLLLSEILPDLQGFCEQFGYIDRPAEIKDYNVLLERIKQGDKWRFRLTANPTKSLKSTDGGRGKVVAHVTTKYEKQWLLERSIKNGFRIADNSFDVVQNKWLRFYKKNNRNSVVSLMAATYEGILEVTDAELFKNTLINGIGRGKAYGMGLLTIMHI